MTDFVKLDKLDIRNGLIYYKIRQQDGSFQKMTIPDSPDARRFVAWIQVHD